MSRSSAGGVTSSWSYEHDPGSRSGRQRTSGSRGGSGRPACRRSATSTTTLGAQRLPRHVLVGVPPVPATRRRLPAPAPLPASRPTRATDGPQRVRSAAARSRRAAPAARDAERRRDADVVHVAVVVEQAEHERADALAVLVHAEPADGAVDGALVLHLEHHPLVGLVRAPRRLGDHAVEAGALEAARTSPRRRRRRRRRREVDRRGASSTSAFSSAARRSRERRRRTGRRRRGRGRRTRRTTPGSRPRASSPRDSAGCMRSCSASKSRPLSPTMTISPSSTNRSGNAVAQRLDQLGEVAGQRPVVAAAELDLVAVAEHDAAEAVPLRLVEHGPTVGNLVDAVHRLRQHRLHGRHDRQLHRAHATRPPSAPTSLCGHGTRGIRRAQRPQTPRRSVP